MDERQIEVQGRRFDLFVIQERRRTAVARFDSNSVTIRLPRWISRSTRIDLINGLTQKVVKRLEKLSRDGFSALDDKKAPAFANGDVINILGSPVRIEVDEQSLAQRSTVRLEPGLLKIRTPLAYDEDARRETISRLTTLGLSKAMLPEVRSRLDALNERFYGFKFNDLKIKSQRRLWGSTTHPRKTINLNVRLLFAPYPILEYVMAHELSHLGQHNHSPAFWALVAKAVPDYKERRKWLRENGGKLGITIR